MAIAEDEERFKRIFLDEALRKALYENGITPDNYQKFEKELRTFFENDAEYQAFVDSYLIQTTIISSREFLKYPQIWIFSSIHAIFSRRSMLMISLK